MGKKANIKLDSTLLSDLKKLTNEATAQKATEKAVLYFLREARQRDILNFLESKRFIPSFDPVKLRNNER